MQSILFLTLLLISLSGFAAFNNLNLIAYALPSEDEIMNKINREAERINDILSEKIQNHPGLSDSDGYCYNSVTALERCEKEITDEMKPYYDEAGKRVWENMK